MKNKMNFLIAPLAFISSYTAYIYYSNKSFGFNAEFVVFLCFTIFVVLTFKTAKELFSQAMDQRAVEIQNQYNQLRSITINSYTSLLTALSKFNNIDEKVVQLLHYFLSKIEIAYNITTIVNVSNYYQFIKTELQSLLLLNSIYENYTKYYFTKEFSTQFQQEYDKSNKLVKFLNDVEYIKGINSQKAKKYNHLFVNL